MRALLAGADGAGRVEGEATVTISANNGEDSKEIQITEENAEVFHLVSLTEAVQTGENTVEFGIEGEGAVAWQIVAVHHPNLDAVLLDQVLIKFYWLREQNELRKKPSTSELIDWISALLRSGIGVEKLESHIPFLGSLLKNEQDTEALDSYQVKGGTLPSSWRELGPRYNQ